MAGIADLNVRIGASVRDFERGMQQVERRIARFQRTFENIGTNLTQSLTLPLVALGTASVQAFGDFESLERAFAAVAAEGTNVAEEIERLRKVAEAPGLGFNEAVQASTRLQAVGISARQAEEIITQYGNAVARSGGGAEAFDGAILALTQVASKGKISAEEINQLNERIFEIRPALQAAFGTADSEELQKLGISSQEFIARTTAEFAKLERVQGGLSNSFENLRDSLRTSLSELGRTISTSLNLTGIFQRLASGVQDAVDRFKALSPEAQAFIVKALAATVAIGPLLIGIAKIASLGTLATQGATLLAKSFGVVAVTLGPVGIALAAIGVIIAAIVKNYRELNPTVDTYNDYLSENTKQLIGQKSELNNLFVALNDSNTSQETRSRLINEINSKYKDYLPQLIKEGDNIDRIKIAQAAANTEFEKKIRLAALEGVLEKQRERLVELATQQYEIETKLARQREVIAKGTRNLITSDASYGTTAATNTTTNIQLAASLRDLEKRLQNVKAAQNELTNASRQTQAALDKTLGSVSRTTSGGGGGTDKSPEALALEARIKQLEASLRTSQRGAGTTTTPSPATAAPREFFDIPLLQTLDLTTQAVAATTLSLGASFDQAQAAAARFRETLLSIQQPKTIVEGLGDATLAAASAFADLAAQGETNLRKLGNAALQAARQTISAFIKEGVTGIVSNILKGPIGKALGPLAVPIAGAAGGAAALLFNTLVNKISPPKLAKGGLAYAPTLATVGDNPNARVDPEVIAPLSKLRSLLDGAGGGGMVAEARISGNDLLLLVERAQLRQNRVR
jgi:tape measure domain-containing protein